jgi:hypothetical protein
VDGNGDVTVLESVRCLECGAYYAKPSDGGTVRRNPGCPECGYVGWVGARVPINEARLQRRSGEDRQHLPRG